MRYPGNESCAQEHQDSMLRDCVGKSQHVSAALAACHASKYEPALSGQLDLLEDSANDKAANL